MQTPKKQFPISNRRHKEFGHLFSGRYKSLIVDGSGSGYLKSVCDYVHLNPVRAGLLKEQKLLESYHWSSYGQYLKAPRQRWSWLRVEQVSFTVRKRTYDFVISPGQCLFVAEQS